MNIMPYVFLLVIHVYIKNTKRQFSMISFKNMSVEHIFSNFAGSVDCLNVIEIITHDIN